MLQTSPPHTIPSFYLLFFQTLDPLICLWGASMDFLTPRTVLSSHIPNPPAPDPGHIMILQQRGGAMLNFAVISAVLLRYTYDLQIWKIVQAAFLIVDLALYYAAWQVLGAQGRLSPSTWRVEDWGSVGITVVAGAVRVAFLMGVGLGKGKNGKRA
jgi:hypothetical protein